MSDETPVVAEGLEQAGDASFERINAPGTPEPKKSDTETPAPVPSTPAPGDNKGGEGKDEIDAKTLDDVKAGKLVPHHRFNEVLTRSKAYESLGTPEEIRQKLEVAVKKAVEDPARPGDQQLDDDDKAIMNHLLKLFPTLKDMPKKLDDLSKFVEKAREESNIAEDNRKQEFSKFCSKADETIASLAKEAGLDVSDELSKNIVLSAVRDVLHADEKLRTKFYAEKDLGVLKDAFDGYWKRFFPGVQRKVRAEILEGKTKQAALHKPPVSGGEPDRETVKEPNSFDEAGERSFARAQK